MHPGSHEDFVDGVAGRLGSCAFWGRFVADGSAGAFDATDPEYGRAFAEAIPGATYEVLAETGHLPQLESPELLASAVRRVAGDRGRDA